ncbi:MAG: iron-sulfur cluster repair di-iron protein [Candidatus Coatesbacteria bacterium]
MSTETLNAASTIAALVEADPARVRIFERLGIDFCCRGNRPLAEACGELGLDAGAVLRELLEPAAGAAPAPAVNDWESLPVTGLVDHILATHHAFLQRELPRLEALMEKVLGAHGDDHPELAELDQVFARLHKEINEHMYKEEAILFPAIRAIVQGQVPSLRGPIQVMLEEHLHAGAELRRMRELTGGYAVPAGGCRSYRALLEGLAAVEADLHLHIHKENHVLFPRVLSPGEPVPVSRAG